MSRLFSLLLFLVACRTSAPAPAVRGPVEVKEVSLSFAPPDQGELGLLLEVENRQPRAGTITLLGWELWLNGRYFAAGELVTSQLLPLGGRAQLSLALPFTLKDVSLTAGPKPLELGVRGGVRVSFAGALQRLPFESRRSVISQGAPLFAAPAEEE